MDEDGRSFAAARRELLGQLELDRKQLLRNIDTCRIRDITRPFIGARSLTGIVRHITSREAAVVAAFRDGPKAAPAGEARPADDGDSSLEAFVAAMAELRETRAALMTEIARVDDEAIAADGSALRALVQSCIDHDREHWHAIAANLAGMPSLRTAGTLPARNKTST